MELNLFVYGTLCPGKPNAHVLETIGGKWIKASVTGRLEQRGWGAKMGFAGIVLDPSGNEVNGYLFNSENLEAHWNALDDFEGKDYKRVVTKAKIKDDTLVESFIYVLRDN